MGNVRLPMVLHFQSSYTQYPTNSCRRELSQPKNKYLCFQMEFVQDTGGLATKLICHGEVMGGLFVI